MTVSHVIHMYRSELIPLYPIKEIEQFIFMAFEDVMHYSRVDVHVKTESEVPPTQFELFETILDGLKRREPIQYLTGSTVFYGLPFRVNPDVLIPRPETEELVHWIAKENPGFKGRIIDLGTGSGCIAIALKDQLPDATLYGIDSSVAALNTAMENASLNKQNISFFHFDMLKQESFGFMNFDMMVSNPPYVTHVEKNQMEENVLNYEPHSALFVPDDDPLLFYRRIVDLADGHLNKGGKLYFEINMKFGTDLVQLLQDRAYRNVELKKDFAGRDRMIRAGKS